MFREELLWQLLPPVIFLNGPCRLRPQWIRNWTDGGDLWLLIKDKSKSRCPRWFLSICPLFLCWLKGLLWLSQYRGLQQSIPSGKCPENSSGSLCVSCGLVTLLNVLGSLWGKNEVQGVDETCICISITTIPIRADKWIHRLKTENEAGIIESSPTLEKAPEKQSNPNGFWITEKLQWLLKKPFLWIFFL